MHQNNRVAVADGALRLCISGASGKMGLEVIDLIKNDSDFNQNFHTVCGIYRNAGSCKLPKVADHNFDLIIDFSAPECTIQALDLAHKRGVPIVIGSTGLSDVQIAKIESAAKNIPIFLCGNFSRAVHVFTKHVTNLAKSLPSDYDIEIIDIHHRNKIDAPSGSAKILLEELSKVRKSKSLSAERFERQAAKGQDEIGISSIRSGEDLIGELRVIFASKYDRIEIMHRSSSRKIYVQGALDAAKWLINKKLGLYGISDMLDG